MGFKIKSETRKMIIIKSLKLKFKIVNDSTSDINLIRIHHKFYLCFHFRPFNRFYILETIVITPF